MSIPPLAERMRPTKLADYIGQKHLLGESGILKKIIEQKQVPSMILWGPPGVGKTTLAQLLSKELDRPFYMLSAVNSGVKDVRETIEKAKQTKFFSAPNPILFIDEIHRFSKSQQDSLLGAVEQGIITLIGATTENPSFEVITPLLSRCQVYVLNGLQESELMEIIQRALAKDSLLKSKKIRIESYNNLLRFSGGDARKLLNIIDLLFNAESSDELVITDESVKNVLQENIASYDKDGEMHYDIISAFIKSIRGSDPNAAVYWLARMLEGGEDPKFIARRLIVSASEDIGLANPNALLLATNAFQAVQMIGMPEARIILSQVSIYLASSAKSNSAYLAINEAINTVKSTGNLPVPLSLRNAPTALMKKIGYGKEYRYSHDYPHNFAYQEFMPEKLSSVSLYLPQNNAKEQELSKRMKEFWKEKYKF